MLTGLVILICILSSRFLEKIPVPSLLFFILLGMLFGENGIFRIPFNDYAFVNTICSISLIFIMFFGGFGTNLHTARPVLPQAVLLSTLGVAATAGITAVSAHFLLNLPWTESFLIGAVISSTDAASVFNILRSGKLALKYNTDSLLEVESGSNDPVSYMMTSIALALLNGEQISVPLLLAQQLLIGILCGVFMGYLAVRLLHKNLLYSQQSHTVFLLAIVILAYALPSMFNGNGYLSIYLCGIWIGQANLPQKKYLIHFFDVLTQIAQVMIFFLLGLLVTPVQLPAVILPAIVLMLVLSFAARPATCFLLLLPFHAAWNQILLVSWAGLRGAASIVFAIAAMLSGTATSYNLYNLIFCMVLLSLSVQGSLLPMIARKLSMLDPASDISRTFNDYQEDSDIHFIKLKISPQHSWCGLTISQLQLPTGLLISMIIRQERILLPTGNTRLEAEDILVLAARSFENHENVHLQEIVIEHGHPYTNHTLAEIPMHSNERIILIKRGINILIPSGSTRIKSGDILIRAN